LFKKKRISPRKKVYEPFGLHTSQHGRRSLLHQEA
jgi:hypothetical protein